jgi:dienelactone hydrolase
MNIILVSDVFGVTPALLEIAKNLGACSINDPYEGQIMGFENEADAYSYFVKTTGLDNYLSTLLKAIRSIESPITIISFSVGASVVWRLSEIKDHHLIKQAFCYYGSQIRNFTKIEPRFKINVVFPASESHFEVVELQDSLSTKNNVATKKVKYLHGFMNFYSSNYSEYGYTEHIKLLRSIAS